MRCYRFESPAVCAFLNRFERCVVVPAELLSQGWERCDRAGLIDCAPSGSRQNTPRLQDCEARERSTFYGCFALSIEVLPTPRPPKSIDPHTSRNDDKSSSSPFAPEFTTAEASARAITSSASAVPWCLREHVSYERLSGYKVADMLAGQRTIPEPTQPAPPSTAEECYLRCLDDDRCRGYSVNHVRQVCALTWFDVANKSDYLLADPNWSFHRKICLPGECTAVTTGFREQ
ncbi:hypothetical protein MTO96_005037 [Rhipicephalus appendiculatus]